LATDIDANISDQLSKLYLFDSLNSTMCGGDMSPYSVSHRFQKQSPSHQTMDIIGAYMSAG